jgi:hypothetical protein
MNINDIHNTILFILDKEQDGFVTHGEIDDMLDRAQLVLFNQYYNNPKVPAAAQPQSYTQNQRVHDSLSAFKQLHTFTTANTPSGVLTLPNDFMNLLSLYTTVYNNTLSRNVYSAVQILPEDELIVRLESQVIPVSADEPIGIMNKENKIQLFPELTSNGGVYYLRRPVKPVFGYTQSGRTITYNPTPYNVSTQPTGSIQLEWHTNDVMNIIMIALQYIGINLDADGVLQYADAKDKEGQ